MKKRIKIQGFLIFLGVLSLAAFYKFVFPSPGFISQFSFIVGITMILKGYLLRMSARGFKSGLNPDGKTLVTQGPYELTRNPMYLGTLLIGLGVCVALLRWWVILIFLAIYLAIYIPQINREEEILSQRFGEEFKKYCASTPKYFPYLRRLLSANPGYYSQIKWPHVKGEAYSLAWTLVFVSAVFVIRNFMLK